MKKLAIALCASAFVALAAPAFAEDNAQAVDANATQATEAVQTNATAAPKKATHKRHARKHKKQVVAQPSNDNNAADANANTNNDAQQSN